MAEENSAPDTKPKKDVNVVICTNGLAPGKSSSTNAEEWGISSEVLQLRRALNVLNDRYARTVVELERLKEKDRALIIEQRSELHSAEEGVMADFDAAVLNSEIQHLKEQLNRKNKEQESLSWELVQKDETLREYKTEIRKNAEQYEKQLQIAHGSFKNQVAELVEKHELELKRLERGNIKPEVDCLDKGCSEESFTDDLVKGASSNREMFRLENIHQLEMDNLRQSKKDLLLENQALQRREQDWTAERNALKKTLDSLRRELEKMAMANARSRRHSTSTVSSYSPPPSYWSSQRSRCQSATSLSLQSSPPSYPAPKSRNKMNTSKLLKQMENMKSTWEWEKHNLTKAMRTQNTDFSDTKCLRELVSSLTQGILEKEDIIQHLKTSHEAFGKQMMKLQKEMKLLQKKL